MLKLFIVVAPMFAAAALAGTVRAETLVPAPLAPAPVIQGGAASTPDVSSVDDFAGGDPAAADSLPEPASWAIMMTGVGLVGGACRRRRANSEAATA